MLIMPKSPGGANEDSPGRLPVLSSAGKAVVGGAATNSNEKLLTYIEGKFRGNLTREIKNLGAVDLRPGGY
jgi:hypothetical protein